MKDKPWEVQGLEAQDTFLVIAPYTSSDNETLDKSAADAALALKILFDETNWKNFNGGIAENSDTGGIVSVAELTSIVTLTLGAAWETADDIDTIIPIVLFKGKAVPFEHYYDIASKTGPTIKIDNTANGGNGMYSTTVTDYEVYLIGALHGVMKSIAGPETTLPLTVTKTKAIGHQNPVRTTQKREGKDTTGRFTFICDMKKKYHANGGAGDHIMNSPGEDLMKLLYGADWQNSPKFNDVDYNDKVFAISVIHWSGKRASSTIDTNIGEVFAVEKRMYHCQISARPTYANVEGGAADSITLDIEVNSRFGARERVIKFITDGATGSKLNT